MAKNFYFEPPKGINGVLIISAKGKKHAKAVAEDQFLNTPPLNGFIEVSETERSEYVKNGVSEYIAYDLDY